MSDCIIAPLGAGETYASAADLLGLDDRAQATVRVPRWTKNGQPLLLLVRALSLEQQELIHRAARRKDALSGGITNDRSVFVAETLRHACVQPQLDSGQTKALVAKNATILEAIVDFVWSVLSRLDHDQIAAIVRDSAELDADELDDDDGSGEIDV